jgi:hypothetical protein
MAKYTQGKWVQDALGMAVLLDDKFDGACIADCTNSGKNGKDGTISNEECIANARLIAAAPELYEALQALSEGWNATVHEQCMDALAKADGKG